MQKVTPKLWPGYPDHSIGVGAFGLVVATAASPTEAVTSRWGAGGEGRGGQAPSPQEREGDHARRRTAAAGRAWQQSRGCRRQTPRGRGEVAGCTMRPVDSTGATELQEPGVRLTEDTPPGASQEPAAAEDVGTPDPHSVWCWLCRSSPCGLRVQPGEWGGVDLGAGLALGGLVGCQHGDPGSRGPGRIVDHDHLLSPAQSSGKPWSCHLGAAKQKSLVRARAKTGKSF